MNNEALTVDEIRNELQAMINHFEDSFQTHKNAGLEAEWLAHKEKYFTTSLQIMASKRWLLTRAMPATKQVQTSGAYLGWLAIESDRLEKRIASLSRGNGLSALTQVVFAISALSTCYGITEIIGGKNDENV